MYFMIRNFGLESTNPRERRAYAHAMRDKAIETGLPEDKIAAVEVANAASRSSKGQGLGEEVVRAMANISFTRSSTKIHGQEDAWQGLGRSFVGKDYERAYLAVGEALGSMFGIELVTPESKLYEVKVNAFTQTLEHPEEALSYAINSGSSLVQYDWSVPGTAQLADMAQLVTRDTASYRNMNLPIGRQADFS